MDVKITDLHWHDFGVSDADKAAQGERDPAAAFFFPTPVWRAHSHEVRMPYMMPYMNAGVIEAVLGITVPPIKDAQTAHESTSASVGSLVLEGHGFLNRLPLTLMSGTVAILHGRADVEWYLPSFIPGLDYVPVAHDFRDLLSKSGDVVQGVIKGEWMMLMTVMSVSGMRWLRFRKWQEHAGLAGIHHVGAQLFVSADEELVWHRCCRRPGMAAHGGEGTARRLGQVQHPCHH